MRAMAAWSPRIWIRIALVAGVLGSAGALVALGAGLWDAPEGPPTLARAQVTVQFVDGDGHPVSRAQVFVLRRPGETIEERWSGEDATLSLNGVTSPRSVLATARGYRLKEVRGVAAHRRVVMEPGYRVRLALRNAPRALEERHIRFLLRIRPHEDLVAASPGLDAAALVDLMAHTAGRGSGPRGLPRGAFGYAVSRTQAGRGILVPMPGRYRVHWGLMDLKAGTWYSLGDECGRQITVEDGTERYVLDVTEGHLGKTLEGLKTSVNRLNADADDE